MRARHRRSVLAREIFGVHRTQGVIAVMLVALSTACGGGDSEGGATHRAKPTNVAVHVDGSKVVTENIGPSGGSFTVTGADGTKFTLQVPKGALLEHTPITMTPVASVSGLPFSGGLVGAVQLRPDALMLWAPAVLTIESPQPVPVREQIGFGSSSDGQGLHLVPLAPRTENVRLYILHFSMAGSAQPQGGAIEYQGGPIQWTEGYWPEPQSPRDRYSQEMAKFLKEQQILDALGYDPNSPVFQEWAERAAERIRAARDAYVQDLTMRLKAAEANCSDVGQVGNVLAEYQAFVRFPELVTEAGTQAGPLDALAQRVRDKCAKQALERCRAGDAVGGQLMLQFQRMSELLGLGDAYTDDEWRDREKCLISILIEDENQVVLDFWRFKGTTGPGLRVAERSRHVYTGTIYLGEDSLWRGQVRVTVGGTYTTPDSIAMKARLAKYANLDENTSFEEAIRAVGNFLEVLGDPPRCNGSYDGAQVFAVEGSFTTGENRKQQVELALIPAGPPEFYRSTPGCPWAEDQEIDGVRVIPTRLVKGQETAIVIDAPKPGDPPRVYRKVVDMKDIHGSTVITVGAK